MEEGLLATEGEVLKCVGMEEFSGRLVAKNSGSMKTNRVSDLERARKAGSLLVVEEILQSGGSYGD